MALADVYEAVPVGAAHLAALREHSWPQQDAGSEAGMGSGLGKEQQSEAFIFCNSCLALSISG